MRWDKERRQKREEEYRKCKGDERGMETDMALSEFPAFADNNASQPSSRIVYHIDELIISINKIIGFSL